MTAKVFVVIAAAAAALTLAGCTAEPPAPKVDTAPSAVPELPVPVLKVGDPFAVDLLGDGQVTVTVAATEVRDSKELVVSVKIQVDKAGKPVAGSTANFLFVDAKQGLHRARVDNQSFPPVNLTTSGQQAGGTLFFDVPSDLISGGQIELVTGRMTHAVWRI